MSDEKRMGRKLHIKVRLRYQSKEYEFIDDHSDFDYEGADQANTYWWAEGNGACDCNRSIYIRRHCDKDFPEMPCGDEIELINQEFIGDWKLSKEWI